MIPHAVALWRSAWSVRSREPRHTSRRFSSGALGTGTAIANIDPRAGRALSVLGVLLLVTLCGWRAVGPDYVEPRLDVPATWSRAPGVEGLTGSEREALAA